MDNRPDEQQRGITMKSSAISLHFEKGKKNHNMVKYKTQNIRYLIVIVWLSFKDGLSSIYLLPKASAASV